ncbi:MAG: LPS assembly protein LptD [Pseudomonadota bacterium]
MKFLIRLFLVFAGCCLLPFFVSAQPATLLADTITLDGQNQLVAAGNVQVFQSETALYADKVIYNQATQRLQIEGDIRLFEGDGFVLLASQAEISDDLRNGLLQSARLVLAQQLQLAANEISRVDGRYTQLFQVTASSCQVCGPDQTPLWQIRAKRVVHDEAARQLYFEGAQLRVLDVPLFYLPRLRLPDPTLERATGWLVPRLKTTSLLGTGLKLPYFIALKPDRDLTLTPFVSPNTRTLEFRYRQAFASGDIQIEGAGTSDSILRSQTRGYVFAEGSFNLPRDYNLTFDVEATSDDAYLLDYGYSSKDRLDSAISLMRTEDRRYFETDLVYYESLRSGERNDSLPPIVYDLSYEIRHPEDRFGGNLTSQFYLHAHQRFDDNDVTGRDVVSAHSALLYRQRGVWGPGFEVTSEIGALGSLYQVSQDSNFSDSPIARFVPQARASLSWPLARKMKDGGRLMLTPVLQVAWSEVYGEDVPNEDSQRVEFDEGNWLNFSRATGLDTFETGGRSTAGMSFDYRPSADWALRGFLGRSYAFDAPLETTLSSGLSGKTSDWLFTMQWTRADGLNLINRALFDDDFTFAKNETRLWWSAAHWDVSSSYVFLVEDPGENRATAVSEWTADGRYAINSNWEASAGVRYDFITDRAANASLGFKYTNECVEVNFGLSRRFTSSTTVSPTTDVDVTVSLKGFSTNRSSNSLRRGRCSGILPS